MKEYIIQTLAKIGVVLSKNITTTAIAIAAFVIGAWLF